MLHSLHSRHVWMHGHVLVWFPAGKASASRSPTMSRRCHPLRGCEGEGEWKLAPRARAATAPRARFEALTSDRNPSSTTTRQPLRRAPPGAEVSLYPANGRQKARAPTPIYSLAHSSTWSTAPLAWVCGSCPGKMLGDGACEVRTLQKSNMNNGVQCSPGRWATGSFPIILCQFRVLI